MQKIWNSGTLEDNQQHGFIMCWYKEADAIQEGFELLSKCITIFDHIGSNEDETLLGKLSRLCAITLAKSSHFLLGCYSLILDGLAQESGAILRPLIETYELLVYLRLDSSRVDEVLDGKKPSAGKIAQKISGDFKGLREVLNVNASHFNYEIDSVQHLFDGNAKIRAIPSHSLNVFRKNLEILNAFQVFVVFEAVNCLFSSGFSAENIANEIEEWRNISVQVFSEGD